MPEKSELTIRIEMLLEAMEDRYQALLKEWPVPFGMEQVSPEEFRRRFFAMTPEQRLEEIRRMGPERVLEIIQSRQGPALS